MSTAADSDLPGELTVGKPIVFGNLTIFPVSSNSPRMDDRFITLDEGLKTGTVEVLEKSSGRPTSGDPFGADPFAAPANLPPRSRAANPPAADDPFAAPSQPAASPPDSNAPAEPTESLQQASAQIPVADDDPFAPAGNDVNQLLVVNRSEKPLYLMPGEVIIGGDQDRTIGQELVIAADGKPTAIDVFCVEHGRWGGRDEAAYAQIVAQSWSGEANSAASLVISSAGSVEETTAAANSGKFVGSVGSLNKHGRMAVQKGDGQQAVWDEVAKQNAKAGVETDSGTFANNYSDADALERLEPYLKHFHQPIEETQNIVGVIVAVNGKVESLDVFESTPLFRKLWPKLLKSYSLDAAHAETPGSENNVATREAAIAFFRDIAAAQTTASETEGSLAISQGESDRVLLFSAHQPRTMEEVGGSASMSGGLGGFGGAMGGGGFFGGAVHSSGFSK